MTTATDAGPVGHLRKLVLGRDGAGLSDGQLLECFLSRRDEAAFTALVRRHGPMVFGVCRRVLANHHDAEDAFQATFLILARKAGTLRQRELLGNWLYGVAYRTALKARTVIARRRARERPACLAPEPVAEVGKVDHELGARLDAALRRLPEKYRVVVVLCDLEGCTKEAVARTLAVPAGTVSSRLARARRRLAKELAPYGPVLAGVASGLTLVGSTATAGVPAPLVRSTARAALRFISGRLVVGVVPTTVRILVEEVIQAMIFSKLRGWGAGLLVVAALSLSAGAWLYQTGAAGAQLPPAPKGLSGPPAAGPRVVQGPPGGRLLFYNEGRLAMVRPDGHDFQWLSRKNPGRHLPGQPRLAPDGRRLAYGVPVEDFQGDGDTPHRVYIRGLNANNSEQDLGIEGIFWCWGPNGKELVVVRSDGDNLSNVVVDVATRRQTELPVPDNHFVTDVSPDGKWLLTFAAERTGEKWGKARLFLVKRDGSSRRALTGPEEDASEGRFSPDGTRVLFYGTDVKPKEPEGVYVMDLAGRGRRRVSAELNGEVMGFCWSPDGRRVAYAWRRQPAKPKDPKDPAFLAQETESFLMVVDADGRNPVTVRSAKANGPYVITLADPDWR